MGKTGPKLTPAVCGANVRSEPMLPFGLKLMNVRTRMSPGFPITHFLNF